MGTENAGCPVGVRMDTGPGLPGRPGHKEAQRMARMAGRQGWAGWMAGLVLALAALAPAAVPPYRDDAPVVSDPLTEAVLTKLKEAKLGPLTRLGMIVLDAGTGEEFVDINSGALMQPASLMKLLTSAAALELVGPEHCFETVVEAHGKIDEKGALKGDVVVRGGGDPSLGSRFQKDRNDVTLLLREWARTMRRAGLKSVEGGVFGDGRRYTGPATGLGWDPSELGEWFSAEVSGLNFNENVIDIIWKSGDRRGSLASYTLVPETNYVQFGTTVRVAPEGARGTYIRYFRFAGSNEIRARGRILPRQTIYGFAAIGDPARYTAWILREAMEREGISVRRGAFGSDLIDDDLLTTQPLVLARQISPPLGEMLPIVNGDSQNLYAEVLLREVAIASGREPSFRGGAEAIEQWLRANRLQRSGTVIVDGSGLSPSNRMPPRLAASVLLRMAQSPHAGMYSRSLAQPGNQSLKGRLVGGENARLLGRVRAKTGYLNGVMTLAGYLTNHGGRDYVFVIMVNGYDRGRGPAAQAFVDELVLLLHDHETLP